MPPPPPATLAPEESRIVPSDRRPGRGARTNDPGRFEGVARVALDDGWPRDEADLPPIRTEVRIERPRSIIARNDSPDLPFDRSINPYRGCEHGCIYCFARPSHAYLNLSPGLDFETKLLARPGAGAVLDRELRRKGYRVATMAMGTNTDPYQPIEGRYRVTREVLEVLAAFNHPVGIVTKGTGIERDIDILAPMAARGLAFVGISVTTLDAGLARRMEPRVPAPKRRLATIRRLAEAGIPVKAMVAPIVPGLTDAELESILAAAAEAGAHSASLGDAAAAARGLGPVPRLAGRTLPRPFQQGDGQAARDARRPGLFGGMGQKDARRRHLCRTGGAAVRSGGEAAGAGPAAAAAALRPVPPAAAPGRSVVAVLAAAARLRYSADRAAGRSGMKWQGRRGSSNIEDRRGRGGGGLVLGGAGGLGLLAVVLVGAFFGVDLTPLLQQDAPQQGGGSLSQGQKDAGQFVAVVLADTEEVWGQVFHDQLGRDYHPTTLVLYSGGSQSPCGFASGATGPFYCPGDRKVYLDTDFFATLKGQLGAGGDFAYAYVVAHEVGHHVQDELGILGKANAARAKMTEAASNAVSVRIELQADCFAGLWAREAQDRLGTLEKGDIAEAMNAASKIGDDTLQKNAGRRPMPDSFTHGTSAQRQKWFGIGYDFGAVESLRYIRGAKSLRSRHAAPWE